MPSAIGTLKKPGIRPGGKKRSDMEDHKIKLYETQLRRLFKAAEQDEQEAPTAPVHREKIRVIRRRKGGPDQYITESSRQYALAAADMG